MLTALRNKKTGRLLIAETKAEQHSSWMSWEGETNTIHKYLELKDSEYLSVVFVTNQEGVIEDLLKDGKTIYPNIIIDFGCGKTLFALHDLEPVPLEIKT